MVVRVMRLYAALIPPSDAVEELAEVVRGAVGRSGELTLNPAWTLQVHLTNFGNVAHADSLALQAALGRQAASWDRPKLQFAGAAALEFPGDVSLWARLDGDTDALHAIARGVPQVVQRLGFLVDRRAFRPWVAVGEITDATTGPGLERIFAAVERYRSALWTVDEISIVRPRRTEEGHSDRPLDVIERLPLGG